MSVRVLLMAAVAAGRESLADRGSLVVTVGFYAVVLAAVGSLWRAAALASGGAVAGYGPLALVWYMAVSEALTTGVRPRLIEVVADDITHGAIAAELLRPASVVGLRIAAEVGRSLPRVALCVAVGAAGALAVEGRPPDAVALVLAAPAAAVAVVANVAAQHAVAAVAFWLRDVRSTWFLYQKVFFIAGGMLLPLEVLPERFGAVARALPFAAMAYAPARLASGHAEPPLLVGQLAWTVALCGTAVVVFAAGQRRLQAVGA